MTEDVAKGGHSNAKWKLLTGKVYDLWHVTNRMFSGILEILEHNGWDMVQVENHNPGNWMGNPIRKLWILKQENLELGLDLPLQYWAEDEWLQQP